MQRMIFIGTYSTRGSEGIYQVQFDTDSGTLHALQPVAALPNPTFQVIHPSGRYLYSVCEERRDGHRHDGSVCAFAVEPETGRLTLLNRVASGGDGPCHLCLDPGGRFVIAANYASGSVAVFPIAGTGRLGKASAVIQHPQGSRVVPDRQEGPHAHSVTMSPDNRLAWVADLGMDRIMVYRFDAGEGTLVPHDSPWVVCAPGSGPRHMAVHPDGRQVFLVHELDNTITQYRYDVERGVLLPGRTLSLLPEGWTGTSYAADVHVSPDGRHVYASNRGHDSLAVFAVDPAAGGMRAGGYVPVGGRWPRNFLLTPDGVFLLAANQESDGVTVFRVDPEWGRLQACGGPLAVPAPVCLTMVPASGLAGAGATLPRSGWLGGGRPAA